MVVVCILALPIWNVNHIEVQNNTHYTDDEIIRVAQVKKEHRLHISFKKAKNNLLKLPYIKSVSINYIFPGKMVIKLTEKEAFAYIPFMGSYLCLDENGQVIEQTDKKILSLPSIKGLNFTQFKVGDMLQVENKDHLAYAIQIIHLLKKYKYDTIINEIDIYNLEQIHLYVNNLHVIIGNIEDFDKKLQWLIETRKLYDVGILDLSHIKNGQAILSPIQ